MNIKNLQVIIQAGGRGSRLRHHTWNKPKCLVSVYGKPILYHLFDSFKGARFYVIGDYQFDQLSNYLETNPPKVDYKLIKANGKGTSSGFCEALNIISQDDPLLIVWSDIYIKSIPNFDIDKFPIVFTTSAFTCRWTVSQNGLMQELPGTNNGIPGIFFFPTANLLPIPPSSGEFVKWLSSNLASFKTVECSNIEELGDFSVIEEKNDRDGFCRFFNKVEIFDDYVTKIVVDSNYQDVHSNEVSWYKQATSLGFRRIPKILNTSPLVMSRIRGRHAYQIDDLTPREKRAVMSDYLDTLISLHDLGSSDFELQDVKSVYIDKTFQRVNSVSKIIPGFEKASITINGRKCRNPFAKNYEYLIPDLENKIIPQSFVPIHGDPTFSNTIVDDFLRVWFIDPRGSFAKSGIMGDPWYDFAKVYYSAVGGYDFFNRRKFKLHVDSDTVEILMDTSPFNEAAQCIFNDYFSNEIPRIQILHSLIWLSLSGYAKDDLDSVIGSFYLGLYWLEAGSSKI